MPFFLLWNVSAFMLMNIEVSLSPSLFDTRVTTGNHVTVAVDILRATSVVCAAFYAGVDHIVPLDSLEPLPYYREQGYLLAAERNGVKLMDATLGNSPTKYLSLDLHGQRVAYSTTNGTVSILCGARAGRCLIGSFANISVLSEALVAECDVVILCSGWKGDPSIEDTLFAGALIERLQRLCDNVCLVNDAAHMSLDLWHIAANDLLNYCQKATHVHRLQRLGFDDDVRWAFLNDTCPYLIAFNDGKLIKIN